MNKKRYILITLIIFIILTLNLVTFYYYHLTQKTAWEKEKKDIELKADNWQEKYNSLLSQLEEYKTNSESYLEEIALLKQRITSLQKEKQDLTQKVERLREPRYLAGIIRDRVRLKLEVKDLAKEIRTKDRAIVSLAKARENLEALLGKEKHLSQKLALSIAEERKKNHSLNQEVTQKFASFTKMETKIDTLENSELLLRDKVKVLEKIVWEKTKEIGMLEKKLNTADGKNKILEKKLSQTKEEKELLEEELASTKRGYEKILAGKTVLENKLEGIIKENEALSTKLLKTSQKAVGLDEKLEKMEEKYESLAQKEKDTSFMLELTKTITLPDDTEESLTEIKAKVLAAGSKHNFVIIDIGEENGVRIGDKFSIYRVDKKIGEIEVGSIRSRSSFATITSSLENLSITIGDIVR